MANQRPSRIEPPATVAFIGLGKMGVPMAGRLATAGFRVRGADPSDAARTRFAKTGGSAFADAREAVAGAAAVVTMLPDGKVVREALLGAGGFAAALARGALVIDMSSSAPTDTTSLGAELASRGIVLIDAPVSGGVGGAASATLAIMAGGPGDQVERARPILAALGKSIFLTGKLGSGHAMKALNNYVSAAGLLAASEALLVGRRFGLEPATIIDVLNASSGRNVATELKLKQFIVSGSYASGFALALMAKDVGIAAALAEHLALDTPLVGATARVWDEARTALAKEADHTEIYRFIAERDRGSKSPG